MGVSLVKGTAVECAFARSNACAAGGPLRLRRVKAAANPRVMLRYVVRRADAFAGGAVADETRPHRSARI
jgi:hypothetical protein